MLALYQLWLDELYPRAKFADGLSMIEKAGHSRRMQVMRREWINEAKSRARLQTQGEDAIPTTASGSSPTELSGAPSANYKPTDDGIDGCQEAGSGIEESLFVEDRDIGTRSPARAGTAPRNGLDHSVDEPPGDELDALLAEDNARNMEASMALSGGRGGREVGDGRPASPSSENDDAAEAVMAEMGW